MKCPLLAIAVVYTASTCAVAEDHLAPCNDDFLGEYERRVEAITQAAMPGPADFWVTVIPSFTPEWSVGVSTVEGRSLLTYVVFDRSFWHSSWVETAPESAINDPSKGHARAKAKTATISAALDEALRSEWDRSVNAARKSEMLGLDGETYNFRLPGKCASAWSPGPSTRNGKLVELVEELVRLARTQNRAPDPRTEADALKKIRDLPGVVD